MSDSTNLHSKKTIVLICPVFFNYYLSIISKYNELGYRVIFFSDRPSESKIAKILLRINRHSLPLKRALYQRMLFKKTNGLTIDYLLVIDGQGISPKIGSVFKKKHPETKTIYYLWDSLSTFPFGKKFFDHFDEILSFEPSDCYINNRLLFVPTFYRDEFETLQDNSNDFSCDSYPLFASFVGTTRPKKYAFVERLKQELSCKGFNVFTYYYLPSKLLFYFYKLTNRNFKRAKISDFHFSKMPSEEVKKLYERSFSIIDSPPLNQTGITVRCYESIAMGKKIISDNASVSIFNRNGHLNALVFPFKEESLMSFAHSSFSLEEEYIRSFNMENFCKRLLNTHNSNLID